MEGWLESDLYTKARHEKVKYIPRHRVHTRVSREICFRETRSSPIKTGWAETDKGQPGTPNMRARWVEKDSKAHVRLDPYAPTPPSEALKMVLSEIATGGRGRTVVAFVDVRRAYFYAPSCRRVVVDSP